MQIRFLDLCRNIKDQEVKAWQQQKTQLKGKPKELESAYREHLRNIDMLTQLIDYVYERECGQNWIDLSFFACFDYAKKKTKVN